MTTAVPLKQLSLSAGRSINRLVILSSVTPSVQEEVLIQERFELLEVMKKEFEARWRSRRRLRRECGRTGSGVGACPRPGGLALLDCAGPGPVAGLGVVGECWRFD
ncbi:MAG: hypothetical protein CME15_09175 [Gemmatimonadetes bacterium]|nr:hypothetical protein [Gemmatimonadota bacterium]